MTISIYWQLLPLLVVISLVYSATRHDDWPSILREAFRWGYRMLGFLLLIGVALFVLARYGLLGVVVFVGVLLLALTAWYIAAWLWERYKSPAVPQ
jgi:hypothetical protein